MPKGKKVRVMMTGTTAWTIRPGDEVSIDAKLAKRWERGNLATIIEPAEPEPTEDLSLAELRTICAAHDLTIRGTKAEVKARILDSGLELKLPEEEKLPFEEEIEKVEYEEVDLTEESLQDPFAKQYEPERALGEPIKVDKELLKEYNPESD